MKTPHLASAAAAVLLLLAALTVSTLWMRRVETRVVHALAPQMFAQKNYGVALQRAAFRQTDLLPLYGSSELNVPNRYHASALFRDYPTGFTVFPIGSAGGTSLIWLQSLAAVGADLRGRKVALSLAARSFMTDTVDDHAYAANFSPLHASELAFNMHLSFAVKQAVAQRMLQFPATLTNDRLLRFALEQLADGSPTSRALYYASVPLGTLHNLAARLADHWDTLVFVRAQLGLGSVTRQSSALDWTGLLSQAERHAEREADGNPFGFANGFWTTHAPDIMRQKNMYTSETARRSIEGSTEWTDLDLLLRVTSELGGEPLILSPPLNGTFHDFLGIDAATRRVYYERLATLAQAHPVEVVAFDEHESDRHFTVNPALHLSDKGWVNYDHALDAFFHGDAM